MQEEGSKQEIKKDEVAVDSLIQMMTISRLILKKLSINPMDQCMIILVYYDVLPPFKEKKNKSSF